MKYWIILFFVLFLSVGYSCASDDFQWRKVDENSFINSDGIIEDQNTFTFILKSFNKGQYESVNGRRINYTLGQYMIDCHNQEYKIGVIDSYDYDGNFVNGDYNRYAKFQPIVSGTAVGEIAKLLCKP